MLRQEESRKKTEDRSQKREETKTISLFMLTYINLVVIENDIGYSSSRMLQH